jgi:uncharacterized membrane protein YedE/YeeE
VTPRNPIRETVIAVAGVAVPLVSTLPIVVLLAVNMLNLGVVALFAVIEQLVGVFVLFVAGLVVAGIIVAGIVGGMIRLVPIPLEESSPAFSFEV